MGVREAMAGRPVCFSAAARSRSIRFRIGRCHGDLCRCKWRRRRCWRGGRSRQLAQVAGDGGNGGSGGTASATILGTVILNGSAGVGQTSGQAVLVQANGGGGGQGGDAGAGIGHAGGGGFAGAGGSATLTLGSATTPGILEDVRQFRAWRRRAERRRWRRQWRLGRFLRDRWCRRSRRRWRSGHGQCAQGFDGCDIGVRDGHEFDCAAGAKRRWRRRGGRRRHRSGHRRRRRDRRQWWAGRQWRPGHAEPGGGRVRFDQPAWRRRCPGAEHRRFGRCRRQCDPEGRRTVLADDRRRRGRGRHWRPGECQQLGIDHQLR